jgi:O-antigen ligase
MARRTGGFTGSAGEYDLVMPVVTTAPAAPPAAIGGDRIVRDSLFLATFLLTWITVSPFTDLSDPAPVGASLQGDTLSQATTLLLTGALGAFALLKRTSLLLRVVTPLLVMTLAWFALSAALSPFADVALRRVVLATFTIFQASVFLLLPYGREHFARLLAVGALAVLAVCYFGVIFVPKLSIHQVTDILEPEHAGSWRGPFPHKNSAGASMVLLIFIGIFAARAWNALAGRAIVALAGIFLIFTQAKTSLILLPLVLIATHFIPRTRGSFFVLLLVLGLPIVINLLTVGSVVFEPIRTLVDYLLPDPTYTGRNEIWTFTLESIAKRPLVGFGFEAFWETPDLLTAWNSKESWGHLAANAHNAYLDLAVTTGVVGLVLASMWIIFEPLADFRRGRMLGADPALTVLFLQIWVFELYLSGFESALFATRNAVWFMMVVAIVGMRFQSIARNNR